MQRAAFLTLLICVAAEAQQDSANRSTAAAPTPFTRKFAVKMLRSLEPESIHAPLTPKLRLHEYVYDTFGPYTIFREAAAAVVSQAMNSPHEWGGGMKGYAERFGSNIGSLAAHGSITYALSAALHEDNRYFASGKQGTWRRVLHAALSPFETRRSDGTIGFSYSNTAGVVGASVISRGWAPPSWQGPESIAKTIGFTFAGEAGYNVFREFLPDLLHHR